MKRGNSWLQWSVLKKSFLGVLMTELIWRCSCVYICREFSLETAGRTFRLTKDMVSVRRFQKTLHGKRRHWACLRAVQWNSEFVHVGKQPSLFSHSGGDCSQCNRAVLWHRQNHVLHLRALVPNPAGGWTEDGENASKQGVTLSDNNSLVLMVSLLILIKLWHISCPVFQLPRHCSSIQMLHPSAEPKPGVYTVCPPAVWVWFHPCII